MLQNIGSLPAACRCYCIHLIAIGGREVSTPPGCHDAAPPAQRQAHSHQSPALPRQWLRDRPAILFCLHEHLAAGMLVEYLPYRYLVSSLTHSCPLTIAINHWFIIKDEDE